MLRVLRELLLPFLPFLLSSLSPSADMQERVANCRSRHCRVEGGWGGERLTDSTRHSVCHNCCADTSRTHVSRSQRPLLLLPHLLLVLLLLLSTVLPVITAPPRCSQPPPSPNCVDAFLFGHYFYYNASSPTRCLRFFHWGCDGDNVFSTEEECMETCEEQGTGAGRERGGKVIAVGKERRAGSAPPAELLFGGACTSHPAEWLAVNTYIMCQIMCASHPHLSQYAGVYYCPPLSMHSVKPLAL